MVIWERILHAKTGRRVVQMYPGHWEFLSQMSSIIPPVDYGSTFKSNHQRVSSRRHPNLMPKPPQLAHPHEGSCSLQMSKTSFRGRLAVCTSSCQSVFRAHDDTWGLECRLKGKFHTQLPLRSTTLTVELMLISLCSFLKIKKQKFT